MRQKKVKDMKRLVISMSAVLLCLCSAQAQEATIDANGRIVIDCTAMPADAVTRKSKGNAATGLVHNGVVSEKSSTVFYRFQVASADCWRAYYTGYHSHSSTYTMDWRTAVGYTSPHTGAYPEDRYIPEDGGTLTNVNPNVTLMRGAPIVNSTTTKYGCNGYWEGSWDDAETGVGHWRLPNKKELLLMWIFKEQLENIDGFSAFNSEKYWSASERSDDSGTYKYGHYVDFRYGHGANENKTTAYRVRCIREIR